MDRPGSYKGTPADEAKRQALINEIAAADAKHAADMIEAANAPRQTMERKGAIPMTRTEERIARSIALVGHMDYTAGQTADIANARLIAAAPEMLEALERVVRYHEIDHRALPAEDIAIVRAAIAKARGGQS